MRSTHFFYYMLIILAFTGLVYCGNGNNGTENSQASDSATANSDSTMSAHNRDPSIAYPEPPVTGSNQDSTRSKDSIK